MALYYTCVLLILLLFSETKESKSLIVMCMLLVGFGDPIGTVVNEFTTFYSSVIFVEVFSLIILTLTLTCHKNYYIFIVYILSCCMNMALYEDVYSGWFVNLLDVHYETINILLYELLLLVCISTTNIKEKLQEIGEVLKYCLVLLKNNNLKTVAPDNPISYMLRFIVWHLRDGVFKKAVFKDGR